MKKTSTSTVNRLLIAFVILAVILMPFMKANAQSNPKLWGLAEYGGLNNDGIFPNNSGTIFNFNLSTFDSSIVSLSDNGEFPWGSLIRASDGLLYGMTTFDLVQNNDGGIFSIDPVSGNVNYVYYFDGTYGQYAYGSLMQASDGNLYGMTNGGGYYGYGVIFSFNIQNQTYTDLYDFGTAINDGTAPNGSLMQATNGNLYGMTSAGGTYSFGVIFEYEIASNTYSIIHHFGNNNDGATPYGNLLQISNGMIYGLTNGGGDFTNGTIFKFDPGNSNQYYLLYSFGDYPDGTFPNASFMQANDGRLYGTTAYGGVQGDGTIFSIDPSNSDNYLSALFSFDGTVTSGATPNGSLIQATDGKLYGTAYWGGANSVGVIFKFDYSNSAYTDVVDFNNNGNGANPNADLLEVDNCVSSAPTVSSDAVNNTICSGATAILTISLGYLGSGASWHWYTGSCGGTAVGSPGTSISVTPTATTTYYVRGEGDCTGNCGTITIVVQTSSCNSISATVNNSPFCAGASSSIDYIAVGTFNGGNIFTAQLSDATGNFTSPTSIGSVSATTSGSISITIPGNASGSGYRIRVVSSDPVTTGSDNGSDITINANPTPVITTWGNDPTSFCDGSAVVLDAGLNGDWDYIWDTGSSDESYDYFKLVSTGGTYTVIVTDFTTGCTGSASQVVTVYPNPTPIITPSGPTTFCYGNTINLVTSDVNDPLTLWDYEWNDSDMGTTTTIGVTNTYIVYVTDGHGCIGTASQDVTVNPLPTPVMTAGGNTTFCQGGSVTLTVDTWVHYLWNAIGGNSTTEAVTAISSGTYTVSVTDGNGCASSTSQMVAVNPNPAPSITGTNPFCVNTSTTLNAGGGFSSYHWDDGSTNQTRTVSVAGTYDVTVSNSYTCTGTAELNVTTMSCNSISTTIDNSSFCNGASSSIDYTAIGTFNGGNIFTAQLSDATGNFTSPTSIGSVSATASGSISITIPGNASGSGYRIRVVSSSPAITGSDNGSDITINSKPTPVITTWGNDPTSFCDGGAVVLDAGLNGDWDYIWDTGSSDESYDYFKLVSTGGTYTVIVTDFTTGCTGSASQVVTVYPNPTPIITPSGPTTFCYGNTINLVTSDVNDPLTLWDYEWNDSDMGTTTTIGVTNTYIVYVTDGHGCIGTASQDVTVNPLPTPVMTAGGNTTFCQGGSVTLTVDTWVHYLWNAIGGNSTTEAVTAISSGTYTVSVTDGNGCASSTSQMVAVNPNPAPSITGTNPFCVNTSTTLNAGGGFSSYHWDDGSTNQTRTVSVAGTYDVTVSNSYTCTGTAELNVTTMSCNSISTTIDNSSFCNGASSSIDYTAIGTFNGGNIFTAQLSDATGNFTSPTSIGSVSATASGSISITIPGNASGSGYRIRVVSSSPAITGSDNGSDITINSKPTPVITTWGNDPTSFCDGGAVVLDAGLNGDWDYIWDTGSSDESYDYFKLVSTGGTYTVIVTDFTTGCSGSASQVVNVFPNPSPTITPPGPITLCYLGSLYIYANDINDPNHNWDYEWSDYISSYEDYESTTGTYIVIATDNNGCIGTASVDITVNDPVEPTITGPTAFCQGGSVMLDAGNPYNDYLWSTTETTETITVTTTGDYFVTITDENGCTGVTDQQVNVYNPQPSISETDESGFYPNDGIICSGSSATLDAGVFDTYLWNTTDITESITVSPVSTTTYSVTVSVGPGCTAVASQLVTVNQSPLLTIDPPGPVSVCGYSLTIDANDINDPNHNWDYMWSDDVDYFEDYESTSGTYTVTVTDNNNCSGSASIDITFNYPPLPSISSTTPTDFCQGGSVILDAGYPYNDYLWSTTETTETITVTTTGDYFVTITDENGCTGVTDQEVTVNNNSSSSTTLTECDSYSWNGNTYTSSGTYTYSTLNVAGCDSTATLHLTINYSNTGTDVQSHCDTYTWIDGNTYTSSNSTATWTLQNAAGCDSVVTLNLTIRHSNTGTDVQSHCDAYTWIDGNTYTSSNNNATWTLQNAAGCDSVVTLNLTIRHSNTGTDVQSHCDTYTWIDGNTYTSSNSTATWTLQNAAGCDSVVTLNLTIRHSNTGTDVQSHCDTYTWIDGNTYTSSNSTATWTLQNAAGCDSVVTLNLTIRHSNTGTDVQSHCDTYTWIDGITYTSSNSTATWTLQNAAGCDSVVTLHLTIRHSNTGTDVQSHCDAYTWIDGNTYTGSNNNATWTLQNAAGCDSVVTLNLTIRHSNTGTDVQSHCDTYTWIDGNTYTSSNSTTTWTLQNAAGCDSVVTLNLTIRHSNTGTDVQSHCDTYTWIDGNTYTSSNSTVTWTLQNSAGCDSVVTLNLTIRHSNTGTDVQSHCDTYTWIDGNTYTSSNSTATWTLQNAAGCDSVVTLNLTIRHSNTGTDVQSHCDAYTWIDGNTYTSSNNNATWTLQNAAGCDSVVTLNLTIRHSNTGTDVQSHCDTYTWIDGNTYTSSNSTATWTLQNAAGCDSVVTLNLTIRHSNTGTDVQSHCDTYTWIDGNTYTSSNSTATWTLQNAAGCDSVVTLNLTIRHSNTGTDVQSHCDTYTWIDGITYTSSNSTATWTLQNAAGCDSVVTLHLTIRHSNTGTDVQSHCDTYTWIDGNTYTGSNNNATWTLQNAAGCDSVVTLNLTIRHSNTGTDVQSHCDTYTWIDGNTYTSSNSTTTWTLQNAAGCDSVVTLNLTIRHSNTGTDVQSHCDTYTWIDGNTYTSSNSTVTWTLQNSAGCDSVVTLNLTIRHSNTGTDVQSHCDTYTWIDGNTYTSSNSTATWTLQNAAGCDSVVTLNLTIRHSNTGTDVQSHCDTYTWIDGNTYTSSNSTATWTLQNAAGCDSVVTLNLTIRHSNTGTDVQSHCDTYTWIDGNTYTSSNSTATWTLQNAAGCDSVVTLNLTIRHSNTGTDVQSHCDTYTWIDGNTYTSSNSTATWTLQNAAGCDSVVTLNLTIRHSNTGTDVQSHCDAYTWIDGNTYTSSNNNATWTLQNAAGCDSVVTLNLTIRHSNTGTDVQSHCDTYTWIDGNTYTSSNSTATWTLQNAAGCDSVVTLNLTIRHSNTGTDVQSHCDTYTWIDGNTYTSSNSTATWTLQNAAGCDSVVTLNLTIRHSNTGTDVQSHCDTYTWIDGITYTSSNSTATWTLQNAAGCDSVVTLHLTIRHSNTGTDVQSHCDAYTWIDGNTYTGSNNNATWTLQNAAGCDSVVTLNLTIRHSNTGTDVQSHCDTYTWIDGNTYTSSNSTATWTLQNAAGCDSVVTLNLTIRHSNTGTDVQSHCDTYTWIDGNTYTASNSTATWTLQNAAGCDSVVTLHLTIYSNPTPTISGAANVCAGNSVTLDAGSWSSYSWNNGGGTNETVMVSSTGNYAYTVTVHDGHGCSGTTAASGTIYTNPTPSISGATNVCFGNTVTLDAGLWSSYSWNNGGGTNETVGVTAAGGYAYTVTIHDGHGCTGTAAASDSIYMLPVVTITPGGPTTFCQGGSVTLTNTPVGSGYHWSNNETTDQITVTTGGSYSVTHTDNHGCTGTAGPVIVTVNPNPVANSSVTTPILCFNTTGVITVSATGGSQPYSGTGTNSVAVGTYTYTVSDNNGCHSTTISSITQPTLLTASSSSGSISCFGGTTSVTVSGNNGTPNYTGSGVFSNVYSGGPYTYTITDANHCTATTTISISQPTQLSASSTQGPSIICNGGNTSISVTASNGTPSYSGTGIHTVGGGSYTYTVTDANGCHASTTQIVTSPSSVTFTTVVTNVSSCGAQNSGSIAVTASGGTGTKTYSDNGGTTYQGATLFSGLIVGTYTIKVKDANGCLSATTNITISPSVSISFSTTIVNATACTAPNGKITVMATGGSGFYNYSDNGGTSYQSSNIFSSLLHGTYSIKVKDATGCLSNVSPAIVGPTSCISRLEDNSIQTNSNTFNVYPNPANDHITIEFTSIKEEATNIRLIDVTGRTVINESENSVVGDNMYQINVLDLAKGVYMILIQNSNGALQQKIVVQ